MKRTLAAIALAVLITGCDSKPDAPFGLKWGQSMDSVSFIKDGDCEKEDGITTCKFDNQKPFNEWTFSNELKFDRDGLIEISSSIMGIEDYSLNINNLQERMKKELDYLSEKGLPNEVGVKILNKCKAIESCDGVDEVKTTKAGTVSIWITRAPDDEPPPVIVTFKRNQ
ncbi:hypothetical protein [Providencia rettgeri]|uniref:hypothetical protein n=1 Tax=Providencia rettgeri TaxID=587 RepID=UPI00384F12A7